jgi:hypothetical protein
MKYIDSTLWRVNQQALFPMLTECASVNGKTQPMHFQAKHPGIISAKAKCWLTMIFNKDEVLLDL